jgi:predicted extracellular nuclease
LTSTDIVVSEAGTTPVGQSLQLTGGPGDEYSDFTWTGPADDSFGFANSGQDFVGDDGVPVWINEIHYDNGGADTGEAIEVVAPAGSNLSNWSLVLYNGSGGAQYATQSLPSSVSDSGNGWGFVHLEIAGIQNGAPDGVALVDGASAVEFLSYEGSFTATDGPAAGMTSTDIGVSENGSEPAGQSLQLTGGPGNDAGDFTWTGPIAATFGAANTGQTFSEAPDPIEPPPTPECGEPTHVISQVQGSGAASPLDGTSGVVVQAVVTADRTGPGGLGGFFIEEETADRDADPATSEGLFVPGTLPAGVVEGDVVQVTGTPDEAFGQTEIDPTEILACDAVGTLPAPAVVTFPLTAVNDLERYEDMVATFPQDLVISEYFNYDRFNETVVGVPPNGETRFHTPTAVVEPGAPAQARAAEYALRRITIDDGRNAQNPSPPYFPGTVDTPFKLDNRFRGGDTLTDVTGVVGFGFSLYRVHPTADATYTSLNPRPADPPAVGGDVKVGSFNVLNYFLTLDEGPTADTCGPTQNQDCRGADVAEELERQRAKIIDALAALDADVVGLMEMENTPGVEPAADLAAGLNDRLGPGTYDYIDTGVVGTDAIRVGYLYQPGSVQPVGDFEVLDSSDDPRFRDNLNRPAIAQTWDEVGTGDRFTTAVNHLKSKGSDCNDVGDPDTGDGQGNCNQTRTLAAQALADWLASDPTGSGDPDKLIIGDLNSYDHEDPIDALVAAGYTDLVKQFNGEFAYGYVFDGQVGYLDHGLSSSTLTPQVTGAGEWHINADEPDLIDYDTSFKGPNEDALYEPNRYRSSDHDAVLIGLALDAALPQACYADGAQSVESFDQGQRANGSNVPPPQSDPENALGTADGKSVSLGLDGEIVLDFSRPVQNNNGPLPDLRIVDESDGAKGRTDRVHVEVSNDGSTWERVGTVRGTGTVDLGDMASARYVRVLDASRSSAMPGAADGYDLDAVEVLTGCAPGVLVE